MPNIPLEDDGLITPEVGDWAEDKYRFVALYDELFATAMKKKWDSRVYLDLYSGPGLVRLRGTTRFSLGSPLIALGIPNPFDRYIFCEQDPQVRDALERRARRHYPKADIQVIPGDCNQEIDKICRAIPSASKHHRVLSFCFADPFDISIKFSTVQRLSRFYVDFLFLLALHMDANRNLALYISPDNHKVEDFLGLPQWRQLWETEGWKDFPRFLAEQYSKRMESIGYLPMPWDKMQHIRSTEKNLPLYRLALFSRHPLALQLWDQVLEYGSDQLKLPGM